MNKLTKQVFAAWMNDEKAGKPEGALWTDGLHIYSYRVTLLTHDIRGYTFNGTVYSATTSRHQRALRTLLDTVDGRTHPIVEVSDPTAKRSLSVGQLLAIRFPPPRRTRACFAALEALEDAKLEKALASASALDAQYAEAAEFDAKYMAGGYEDHNDPDFTVGGTDELRRAALNMGQP